MPNWTLIVFGIAILTWVIATAAERVGGENVGCTLWILGAVGMFGFAVYANSDSPEYSRCDRVTPIYSLERTGDTYGHFGGFMYGYGVIETRQVFVFYKRVNSAYFITQIDAENVPIYEDSTVEPQVRLFHFYTKNPTSRWLHGRWFKSIPEYSTGNGISQWKWVMVVPPNSIRKEYRF